MADHVPAVITCPDCGTTTDRDYSPFWGWFADPQRDMPLLLAWARTQPCHHCAAQRYEQQQSRHQGGGQRDGSESVVSLVLQSHLACEMAFGAYTPT